MNQHTLDSALAAFHRLEGCINAGHGADAVSMCIDMMQTELDLALDMYPDMDTGVFDRIIDNAVETYNKLLARGRLDEQPEVTDIES